MGLMNKQYKDLIDDAYENFGDRVDEMWQKSDVGDLDDFLYDGLLVDGTDENGKWFARLLSKDEFINRVKTDDVFAKRWNITIETKELTEDERINLLHIKHGNKGHHIEAGFNMLDEFDIPKKLIRATYKNKTIENYE
jgi:hypothetical protein